MLGDASGISPLGVIHHRDKFELLSALRRVLADYSFDKIIVGDMGEGETGAFVAEFMAALRKITDAEIEVVSERYSSKQSEKEMDAFKMDSDDHSMSAVQMLREYSEGSSISRAE